MMKNEKKTCMKPTYWYIFRFLPHGSPRLDGTQSSLFSESSTHVAMAQLACEDVVNPKSLGFWYDKAMKEADMMTGTWARPI